MFLFPVGAVPKISSIRFYISEVINFWNWTALIVYYNCFGLDAPVIAVDTSGFLMTHANANCACVIFNSSANSLNFLKAYKFFSFLSSPKNLSWICLKSEYVSNLLPSGIPLLYFPVKIPLANGDQTVVPSFLFSNNLAKSISNRYLV